MMRGLLWLQIYKNDSDFNKYNEHKIVLDCFLFLCAKFECHGYS